MPADSEFNPRKLIRITSDTLNQNATLEDLKDAISEVELLAKTNQGGALVDIYPSDRHEEAVDLLFSYLRLETDKEYADRLKREALIASREEESERRLLQYLKEKYQ